MPDVRNLISALDSAKKQRTKNEALRVALLESEEYLQRLHANTFTECLRQGLNNAHLSANRCLDAFCWQHNTIRSMARVRRGLSPMRRALRDSITCWRARHVLHSRQSNKLFYVEHIESESILGEEHDAFDQIVVEWMFLSEYSLRGFIAFDWVDG